MIALYICLFLTAGLTLQVISASDNVQNNQTLLRLSLNFSCTTQASGNETQDLVQSFTYALYNLLALPEGYLTITAQECQRTKVQIDVSYRNITDETQRSMIDMRSAVLTSAAQNKDPFFRVESLRILQGPYTAAPLPSSQVSMGNVGLTVGGIVGLLLFMLLFGFVGKKWKQFQLSRQISCTVTNDVQEEMLMQVHPSIEQT